MPTSGNDDGDDEQQVLVVVGPGAVDVGLAELDDRLAASARAGAGLSVIAERAAGSRRRRSTSTGEHDERERASIGGRLVRLELAVGAVLRRRGSPSERCRRTS